MVTLSERINGALLGHAAGDCLGAPVEFLTPDQVTATTGPVTEIVGGGGLGWRPGQGTDDTDQNLAVVDSYLANGGRLDIDDITRRLVAWYRSRPRDIGTTIARALRRLAAGQVTAGCGDDASHANGSLMRALGPGIAHRDHPDQRRRAAAALSSITHAHPVCVAACVVYADIVSALLHGHRPHDVLDDVADGYLWPEPIRAAVGDAHRGLSVGMAGTGSVVDSLRLAGAALVAAEQRGLEAVLVDVVNRGGDADTNAAIAGGLLGARHGRRAVPDRWTRRLEQRRRIERGAAQLAELASTGGGAS